MPTYATSTMPGRTGSSALTVPLTPVNRRFMHVTMTRGSKRGAVGAGSTRGGYFRSAVGSRHTQTS